MKLILTLFIMIFAFYLFTAFYLYHKQEEIIFPGAFLRTKVFEKPEWIQEVQLRSLDEKIIFAWTNKDKLKSPTVFFFHGNFENITSRVDLYERLRDAGFNFVAPSIRGYIGPKYTPTVNLMYQDGEAVIESFKSQTEAGVHLVGYSLGGALAAYLSYRFPVDKLVLISTFTSLISMAQNHPIYRFFTPIVKTDLPSLQYLMNTKANKVLLVHGTADLTVTFEEFKRFKAYLGRDPKYVFKEYPGEDHSTIVSTALDDIITFLKATD